MLGSGEECLVPTFVKRGKIREHRRATFNNDVPLHAEKGRSEMLKTDDTAVMLDLEGIKGKTGTGWRGTAVMHAAACRISGKGGTVLNQAAPDPVKKSSGFPRLLRNRSVTAVAAGCGGAESGSEIFVFTVQIRFENIVQYNNIRSLDFTC